MKNEHRRIMDRVKVRMGRSSNGMRTGVRQQQKQVKYMGIVKCLTVLLPPL